MDRYSKLDRNLRIMLQFQKLRTDQLLHASRFMESFGQLNRITEQIKEQIKWSAPILENPFSRLNASIFGGNYPFNTLSLDAHFQQLVQQQKTILSSIDVSFLNQLSLLPLQRISQALASIEVLTFEIQIPPLFLQQTVRAVESYQVFANQQLRRALLKSNDVIKKRVLAITDVAGECLEDTYGLALNVWEEWGNSDNELELAPEKVVKCNYFSSLNKHLAWAYRADKDVEIPEAVYNSLPAEIQTAGFQLGQLVIQLNQMAETTTGKDIFKPTNQNMAGMLMLPMVIAEDAATFANVVDTLYFLIYEGTGEAKRLLSLVKDDQLQPLWWLKHLRRMFRHDIDHGKTAEIERKRLESGAVLRQLSGVVWPKKPIHWKRAQLNLYLELIDMLENIIESGEFILRKNEALSLAPSKKRPVQ